MKKAIEYILFILILLLIYFYRTEINIIAIKAYNYYSGNSAKINEYSKNINYLNFQKTTDFVPNNKQELINVIYTILDDGITDYMFYCGYDECEEDLDDVANNGILQVINNYVHPYNSFKLFNYNSMLNVVSISIDRSYNDNEISIINSRLNYIIPTIISSTMNDHDKIMAFHDYIVNNTKYEQDETKGENHKAYSIIVNGKGVCSGYADILDIFLYKMGYKSIKVANEDHVWNALFLDNQIYNIDMTWDDPIATDGDKLLHDYFMISTSELMDLDKENKHNFDRNLYLELK